MGTTYVDRDRLARAKDSYAVRRVPLAAFTTILEDHRSPTAGEVVLARVETLGQHDGVERPTGRRSTLYAGDEVLVAYGNRYAPDQFEAEVPSDLGACSLVAAGGLAARLRSRHGRMSDPTQLTPIGVLADGDGRPVNLADWALPLTIHRGTRPPTIAVVGTSMNAGKTIAVAGLIRGLVGSGHRVGAAKVTGTAAGKDLWRMRDAGVDPAFDFSDAGHASTYLADPAAVQEVVDRLSAHIAASGVDAVVLEVADGLFQRETAALLASPAFVASVDAVLFAAGDSMGAAAGTLWLRQRGLPLRAISGMVTMSPLGMREAAAATDLPVLTNAQLQAGAGSVLLGAQALAA